MRIKKYLYRFLIVISISLTFHFIASAQPSDGDPGDDPDRVPLDPGTWVLVAAGVGYGVKKVKESRKQKQSQQDTENNTTDFK